MTDPSKEPSSDFVKRETLRLYEAVSADLVGEQEVFPRCFAGEYKDLTQVTLIFQRNFSTEATQASAMAIANMGMDRPPHETGERLARALVEITADCCDCPIHGLAMATQMLVHQFESLMKTAEEHGEAQAEKTARNIITKIMGAQDDGPSKDDNDTEDNN